MDVPVLLFKSICMGLRQRTVYIIDPLEHDPGAAFAIVAAASSTLKNNGRLKTWPPLELR